MKEGKYKITVCILTYNHRHFIGEAIESVLSQNADFSWNILIADDCSTDGTREILQEYALKYTDKIELILQVRNVGMQENFRDLFLTPDSKYIAFLDGDDIWIDSKRLQKQYDFLEQSPDYTIVYGKSTLMDVNGKAIPYNRRPDFKSGYIFEDILTCKYLPSMTAALMRTEEIRKMYPTRTEPGFDFYVIINICKNGKAAFLDEVFYCYRINSSSITSTQLPFIRDLHLGVIGSFKKEYPRLVKKGVKNGNLQLLYHYAEKDPGFKNFFLLLKNFRFSALYTRQVMKCMLNMAKSPFK